MIIELGNHSQLNAIDGNPRVTTIHIPEADDTGQGGYTHDPGQLTGQELRAHHEHAITHRNGVTELPDHEALVSIMNVWASQSDVMPHWVKVHPHPLTPAGHAEDFENVLADAFHCDVASDAVLVTKEDRYWTRFGPPGHDAPGLPPLTALFTDVGRVQQANNSGGGQVGTSGTLTGSTATSATVSGAAWVTNMWAGYRMVAALSTGQLVWSNILSNTATVLTIGRWYSFATPGGAAAATPSATGAYAILDGGMTSAWFVGLSTTNWTTTPPAASNQALAGEYNVAGGGLNRKIAPFALTSGTSPMSYTLSPVWTANGSDVLPATFYQAGRFTSILTSNLLAMKFITPLVATISITAAAQQASLVATVLGS